MTTLTTMNILKDENKRIFKGSTKPFINYLTFTKILLSIFIGLFCSLRTTLAGFACLSNPCIFGVCIDDLNSTYSCYCIDGYTGIQCQTNWDECWSSPCANGGTCIDGVAQYNCSCPEGFVGQNCEENLDECLSNPCQNGGTCHDKDNGYICTCALGYLGKHCENDVAVCETGNVTRCENGGQCVEGPGLEFSCKCPPGWQGLSCGDEINECESSPCQNGGVCIDKLASYSCACTMGFSGTNCEESVLVCEDSPCENGALCLMEEGQPVCYCVPDYHGEKCELQYDECQLGPRCMNGGSCIDGVDDFTCSCPPLLTGILCECLLLRNGDLDCNYTRPTLTTQTEQTTTEQITSTYFDSYSTNEYNFTTTKTDSTSDIFVYSSSIFSTVPTMNNSITPSFTLSSSSIPSYDQTTEISSTTSKDDVSATSTEKSSPSTICFISTESSSTTTKSSVDETEKPFITPILITTTEFSGIENQTVTTKNDDTSYSSVFDDTTIGTTILYSSTIKPIDASTKIDITSSTEKITTLPSPQSTTQTTTVSSESITPFFTDTPDIYTKFSSSTIKTSSPEYDFNSTTTSSTSTTSESTTTVSSISTSSSTYSISDKTTPYYSTSTTFGIDNTTESFDCMKFPCYNGGTCVNTSEGSKCVCRFDKQGKLCESTVKIRKAAFAGDSYLSHQIYSQNYDDINEESLLMMQIELKARTRATDGLIILAAAQGNHGGHYLALFLHRGLLQFQFSCGLQTMLLSELEAPVNTGDEMLIQVELDFSRNHSHCNASLRVNDTLAMSGDQPTWLNLQENEQHMTKSIQNTWLHLGGAPQAPFGLINDVPGGQGFAGCLHDLKINGKSREIFGDALDGFGITECGSLACLSNPCRNGAICIEIEKENNENNENDIFENPIYENKNHEKWKCKCPTGYMGETCEISVCDNNPCQYGGTCVTFPGSGYLCLCPLGKHGHYCEHNLEIAQPSFSGSVKGLSSYVAYPVPVPLDYTLELSFKILPTTMSQIALLAFLGQTGYHDEKSDHMAISFIQGYIMLTWNLGGGPRRIFIQKPIEMKSEGQTHEIKIGRTGRKAWLSVDGKSNITGRSPGNLSRLDVMPILYLGGHEHANFSTLPHDLPLHSGFQGCIFDVSLKAGMVTVPLQDTKGVRGRGVGQCGTRECHRYACQHDGACLQYGATFTCICQEGWYGPLCAHQSNVCDSSNNQCAEGSFCVPLVNSYECDCPTGKSGRNCNSKIKSLSDISLSGRRSFLSVKWPSQNNKSEISMHDNEISHQKIQHFPFRRMQNIGFFKPKTITNQIFLKFVNEVDKPIETDLEKNLQPMSENVLAKLPSQFEQHNRVQFFSIELQVRPLSERGILLFFGSFEDNLEKPTVGFVSLSLQGGVVEFRIAGPENHISIVRSSRILAIGEWHKIKMSQHGKRLSLWVEGSTTQATLPSGFVFLNSDEIIYLGGLPDLSKLPHNAVSGFPMPFRGCIRHLIVSGIRVVLNETNILDSRNILDCDGTPCGGDSCELGGHCWLDEKMQPHCKCPGNSKGDRCEISESCKIVKCKNGGKCNLNGQCSCPNGWGGFYCEIATSKHSTPSFHGMSYLKIPPSRTVSQKDKRAGPSLYIKPKDSVQISIKFSTIHLNGMLMWGSRDEDKFLGLGIENGHLKLASNLLGIDNATVDVPAGGFVSDGAWHTVLIDINSDSISMSVDGRVIFSENKRNIDISKLEDIESVTLDDTFYIGGFPNETSIQKLTGNKFYQSFSGCLQDITFGTEQKSQIDDYSLYEGENIGSCELYDEFMNL